MRLTAAGLLEKVGHGLYRLPDAQVSEFESLGTIATKVSQAVFCLLNAAKTQGGDFNQVLETRPNWNNPGEQVSEHETGYQSAPAPASLVATAY